MLHEENIESEMSASMRMNIACYVLSLLSYQFVYDFWPFEADVRNHTIFSRQKQTSP